MLCHPSSVDSLSTSAGTEDHVSMGGWSARKAIRVVENVEQGLEYVFHELCFIIEYNFVMTLKVDTNIATILQGYLAACLLIL